jgi:phenylpyruvate tautomerase PptA (4-oxalocrotonate tautomerase family)
VNIAKRQFRGDRDKLEAAHSGGRDAFDGALALAEHLVGLRVHLLPCGRREFARLLLMGGAGLGVAGVVLVWVRADIRSGRTREQNAAILQRIMRETGEILGTSPENVWVYVSDIPAEGVAEFGHVLPQPGGEEEWLASLPRSPREADGGLLIGPLLSGHGKEVNLAASSLIDPFRSSDKLRPGRTAGSGVDNGTSGVSLMPIHESRLPHARLPLASATTVRSRASIPLALDESSEAMRLRRLTRSAPMSASEMPANAAERPGWALSRMSGPARNGKPA